jgi:hypothetical protein
VLARTSSRTDGSSRADTIALMSPNDSWNEATSMLAAFQSCGRMASSSA